MIIEVNNMLYLFKTDNYKIRNCFRCKCPMSIESFITTNSFFNEFTLLQLTKIWNSDKIELYCCSCYEVLVYERITNINKLFKK